MISKVWLSRYLISVPLVLLLSCAPSPNNSPSLALETRPTQGGASGRVICGANSNTTACIASMSSAAASQRAATENLPSSTEIPIMGSSPALVPPTVGGESADPSEAIPPFSPEPGGDATPGIPPFVPSGGGEGSTDAVPPSPDLSTAPSSSAESDTEPVSAALPESDTVWARRTAQGCVDIDLSYIVYEYQWDFVTWLRTTQTQAGTGDTIATLPTAVCDMFEGAKARGITLSELISGMEQQISALATEAEITLNSIRQLSMEPDVLIASLKSKTQPGRDLENASMLQAVINGYILLEFYQRIVVETVKHLSAQQNRLE